jgi:hypothetical protein
LELWAVEGRLPEVNDYGKHFKSLTKMAAKGKLVKSDVHHVERFEVHLGFQNRPRPAQVAPSVWVFVALILRNPSLVGPLVPTCKIGITP